MNEHDKHDERGAGGGELCMVRGGLRGTRRVAGAA